ncbi:MAG: YHS domain-containing (seleno)protein [Paracoccaceae bacterium]
MLTRRKALVVMTCALATPTFAASPPIFVNANRIAINDYDPVAYFTQSRPVAGVSQHSVEWMGAIWHFSNAQNQSRFASTPDAFAPQFGGYCAYAASKGAIAPTIPEAWTVYKGQLFLNANLKARELWLRDIPGNIALANGFWPGILS